MSPLFTKKNNDQTQDIELLECMRKIGKALLATGSPVGVVENTLIEIAEAYQRSCEIVALPNTLMIKLGTIATGGISDFSVQKQESIFLNRISAIGVLIDDVKARRILGSSGFGGDRPDLFTPPAIFRLDQDCGLCHCHRGSDASLSTGSDGVAYHRQPRFSGCASG